VQVIRHCFHLDEGISVIFANLLYNLFDGFFDFTPDYLMTVLWAKHNMIVDIVDAVFGFVFHGLIISSLFERLYYMRKLKNQVPLSSHGLVLNIPG